MLLKTDLHTDTQFKNGILSYPFVILVLSVTSNNLPVTGQRHVVGDELGWLPPTFGLQKTRAFEADSAAKEAGRAQRSLPSSTGGDDWKRWDVAFMALSKEMGNFMQFRGQFRGPFFRHVNFWLPCFRSLYPTKAPKNC